MKLRVSSLAKETTKTVNGIWSMVNEELIEKGGSNYQGMRKKQVLDLVYNLLSWLFSEQQKNPFQRWN